MHFHNGMIEAIGNTPMIKLKKASAKPVAIYSAKPNL